MKSFVLLAFLNVNGVDYPQDTRFFDTAEQCSHKLVLCEKRVAELNSEGVKATVRAKCHKITPEVDE